MAEVSEEELDRLMSRLSDGDRGAFDPLFRELHPRALRLARAHLPADVAADVAQTTMMKLFARAIDFEPGRPALPWFYAIAANEIRAARRGDKRASTTVSIDAGHDSIASDAVDAESALSEQELTVALDRAVASLDPASVEAIYALLGRGPMPVVEPATFRKRVSRAYARLRFLLGVAHGE